jgi:predicted  nucleic acid-binding Zn-ribbon protein
MPDLDHDALLRLLDLQEEDTAIKRLEEQRASLPEATRLAEVRETLAELENDLAIATKHDEEAGREQHRLEGEVELVEQEMARDDQRLLSGSVSNPKELSALQAKVAELKRKKSGLEDELIEVMEQKERTATTLERLRSEHEGTDKEASSLQETVGGLTEDIDTQLERHSSARGEVATAIPGDLLALYERIRSQKHGVGAAALEGGTCQGCHTKLPAVELEKIKHEGGLQRCENCRRIVVLR